VTSGKTAPPYTYTDTQVPPQSFLPAQAVMKIFF